MTQAQQRCDEKAAEANAQKAKTNLDFFKKEHGRYKDLAMQGAVSLERRDSHLQELNAGKANLDALVAAKNSALSNINSAKAAVHVAQAALDTAKFKLNQVEATRSFKTVRAPFDGIVTKRNVDAGALITSGSNSSNTLLFNVAKTDVLRVFVYVPAQYIPYVKVGAKARLNFQEYPAKDFTSVVSNVSAGVDTDSKTLQVEIHVANANKKLLPGMYVKVGFLSNSKFRLPELPSPTLQTRADGIFVFTVDHENKVHIHKVTIARDFGGKVEIEQGIQPGDLAIVNPPDDLREGTVVKPVLEKVASTSQKK